MPGRYRELARGWWLTLSILLATLPGKAEAPLTAQAEFADEPEEALTPAPETELPPVREPQPFRLIWSSSAACQGPATFLAELQSRTHLLREARTNEHAITLIVATFVDGRGVRGELTVRKPDGELSVREVPGTDCHEVEAAMALIAALVVDPLAGNKEPLGSPRPVPRSAPPAPARERTRWSLRGDPRVTMRSAMAPGWSPGLAVGVTLTHETSKLRPSLTISWQRSQTTSSVSSGSAEMLLTAARLTACPAGLAPNESWDLRACAQLELGRLRGVGFATVSPARKSVLWSAAGAELQVRYRLLEPLWIGSEGLLTFPFSREKFYFDPSQTLHRVPAWGLAFGAGLGLRFM